ncbi:MAG TPA: photosystem reaction center subunit H [Rhodospirillaceae bacterium]|nr:photosystem reaction center subunit H [Rhodospirillaceae bacterium]
MMAFAMPAQAQGDTQTIQLVKVDVQKLSSGFRVSKIIGSNVLNDLGETIGTVDDLLFMRSEGKSLVGRIVDPNDDNVSAYAVVSVGVFLGLGTRLIAIPYGNLRIEENKITLAGATKEGLKALPEFTYTTK